MLIWKRPTDSEARRQHNDDNWTSDLPPFLRADNRMRCHETRCAHFSQLRSKCNCFYVKSLPFRMKVSWSQSNTRSHTNDCAIFNTNWTWFTELIYLVKFLKNLNQWIQWHLKMTQRLFVHRKSEGNKKANSTINIFWPFSFIRLGSGGDGEQDKFFRELANTAAKVILWNCRWPIIIIVVLLMASKNEQCTLQRMFFVVDFSCLSSILLSDYTSATCVELDFSSNYLEQAKGQTRVCFLVPK